jgi:hypothetical protein
MTEDTLTLIEDTKLEGQRVVVDGKIHRNCHFLNCDVVFQGGQYHLENSTFENVNWHFEGAAGNTVLTLNYLFNMPGDGSTRQMVENLLRGSANPCSVAGHAPGRAP